MPERRPWNWFLAVAFAAFLAQLPGVSDTFLWDDFGLLVLSDFYTSPAHWAESVTVPLARHTVFFRPAGTTSFLLESLVHGGVAWGFRLTSALLHAAAAGTAFLLFERLLKHRIAAVLAALAWAMHPAQVETATWISARFDLLAVICVLVALALVPGDETPSRTRLGVAALVTAIACLAKEQAFQLPALALLWVAALGAPLRRAPLRAAAWTAGGAAFALFLRWEAIGQTFRGPDTITSESPFIERLLLVGRSIAEYLQMLVLPWGTVGPIHLGTRPIPHDDLRGWIGVVLGCALLALTIFAWRRNRPVGLLLVAFLLTLLPVIQIVPLDLAGGVHACDRYLYLPSFFAIAAAALAIVPVVVNVPGRARIAALAAAALVVAFTAGRLAIVTRWNDPERFWTWMVERAPGNAVSETNLAYRILDNGRPADAEVHARRAGPEGAEALIDALVSQRRVDEALTAADAAIVARPREPELLLRRGELRLVVRRWTAAAEDFEAAMAVERTRGTFMNPVTARALAGSAEAIAAAGGPSDEASRRLDDAERLARPRDVATWLRITRGRLLLGEFDRARKALAQAREAGAAQSALDELAAAIRERSGGR